MNKIVKACPGNPLRATNKMKHQPRVIENEAYELETARKEQPKRSSNLRRGINRLSSKHSNPAHH